MATAFVPIAVVPADGARLDPERGRQLELGGQLELARGVRVERSVYDIRQTNVVVARPNGLFKQAGRLTSRGLELSTEVESSVGLRLRAGYAWTRARYDSYVSGDVDYSGKRPPFVFDHSATLWGTYRHPWGLGAGLGVRALGRAFGDAANDVPLPAYGVLDAVYPGAPWSALVTLRIAE